MAEVSELSGGDIVSLLIGVVSLILAVIFIQDKTMKLVIAIIVLLLILTALFIILLREIKNNSDEIKKMNERINIYERINKLEAMMALKGDKK